MRINNLLPCVAILMLTACSDDIAGGSDNPSHIIFGIIDDGMTRGMAAQTVSHFDLCDPCDTVSVRCTVDGYDMMPQSRAVPSDDVKGFRAWAFLHDGMTSKPFFADEAVSEKGAYWTTSQPYYWPTADDARLSFVALAGIPEEGLSVNVNDNDLSLNYTVPSKAAAQTVLMAAETPSVNGNGIPGYRVPMAFRHICAAVRFKAGTPLMPGSIEKITLSGIKATGTYSKGGWNGLDNSRSFSIDTPVATTGNEAEGEDLYQSYQTLMLLPQALGSDARLEVVFSDKTSGTKRTLSASLAGQEWPMGKVITYHIGITPDFQLEFINTPPEQDAHYVMCNTAINVRGIAAGAGWTLTAEADDGADVTIQKEADVDEYARQGFWIDKRMRNGTVLNESARGLSSISGVGNVESLPVRVFIPENVGENKRNITLRLHVDGTPASTASTHVISQANPVWAGSAGWERIDDNDRSIYGFCYEARHVYVYNNSNTIATANSVVSQVNNLIGQYEASGYATVQRYTITSLVAYRNYVDIDYRKLNSLGGKSVSVTDGLQNTRELFAFGGTAISRNFENAIRNMARVTDSSVKAYVERRGRPGDAQYNVPEWIEGVEINESQALASVLKKNRYYLNTTTGEGLTTTTPLIKVEDIVWYLPASGQFGSAPAWGDGTAADGGEYWSSTAATGSNAYTGGGASVSRTLIKKIRVARNRP